jgi:hypothetical protein
MTLCKDCKFKPKIDCKADKEDVISNIAEEVLECSKFIKE